MEGPIPSRTLKPIFDQSIVLTGGGGNTMADECEVLELNKRE